MLQAYGKHGVDVRLQSFTSPGPDTVYWSERTNSYVCVADTHGPWVTSDGKPCALLSINGIGEIRWSVPAKPFDEEQIAAVKHFGLKPKE